GLFTALFAPLAFDWAWEHPLLILVAAALMPASARLDWRRLPGLEQSTLQLVVATSLGIALLCCWQIYVIVGEDGPRSAAAWWLAGVTFGGLVVSQWRWLALPLLAVAMLAEGGMLTVKETLNGMRQRSYFGIYTVRYDPVAKLRTIAHGTTLHGQQSTDPRLRLTPLSYYGPSSGAGIAFGHAQTMFGASARIGVVGLGAGSLACYHRPGESWRFFEIDPLVLSYSENRTFTYLKDCAPDARVVIGDARLELEKVAPASLDLLAVDAFSSDAIPLHLLTDEALGVYERALAPRGILLIHISNRFIDLEPVLSVDARKKGLTARKREDNPDMTQGYTASTWIALSRDPAMLAALQAQAPNDPWEPLAASTSQVWTDDHASILPHVRWQNILGVPK
ncbi:MAG: hypothetical protein KGM49_06105, partial [Sphingomonadales bacterium]|nr:hypothetical protein [Sphingomonadales bacterium]